MWLARWPDCEYFSWVLVTTRLWTVYGTLWGWLLHVVTIPLCCISEWSYAQDTKLMTSPFEVFWCGYGVILPPAYLCPQAVQRTMSHGKADAQRTGKLRLETIKKLHTLLELFHLAISLLQGWKCLLRDLTLSLTSKAISLGHSFSLFGRLEPDCWMKLRAPKSTVFTKVQKFWLFPATWLQAWIWTLLISLSATPTCLIMRKSVLQ